MKPIKIKSVSEIWHNLRIQSQNAGFYVRREAGANLSSKVIQSINSVRNESN